MTGRDSHIRPQPLAGIRVLELSRVLAGPFATKLLGDLGADVIKVEDRVGGDTTRKNKPHVNGLSHYFLSLNRNKRSIALDLRTASGREVVERLIASADVVTHNFRPAVA